MTSPLLEVENLHLSIHQSHLLQGICFSIYPKEIVGLVGESGSGKSLTASAILGLHPSSAVCKGKIFFQGKDLFSDAKDKIADFRGTRISLILQDPTLALNPLIPVGKQLIEGLCYHKRITYQAAYVEGVSWLERVGIGDPHRRMRQYPHEISGGMKQRMLIAIALICKPSLVIADEPTTALDATIQVQILDLLQDLQREEGISILLITHDLGVVARCCQRVIVMQAGKAVEIGSVDQIYYTPQHPYTKNLLNSRRFFEEGKNVSS